MAARSPSAERLTGACALLFLVLILIQNLVKAWTGPKNDATAAQLLSFLDHRAWTVHLLVITYLLGLPALFLFASGLVRATIARDPEATPWAGLGQSCTVVIAVLFGLLNALQVTMLAARDALATQPAVLTTLWTLHNAVFTLNLFAVAGALLGFGRATALAGLLPSRFPAVTVAGVALLAAAAAPTVAEVHGSPLLGLGLAGFLVWLVFLGVVGIRLLKDAPTSRTAPQAASPPVRNAEAKA